MLDTTILMNTITCPKCNGLGYKVGIDDNGKINATKNVMCNFCESVGRVIDSGVYDIVSKYIELPKDKYLQISRELTTYWTQKLNDCYDTGMRDAQPKEPVTF